MPVTVLPYGGIINKTTNKMSAWDFRATAAYNDVYANDHIVNLYGGLEVNSIDRTATGSVAGVCSTHLVRLPTMPIRCSRRVLRRIPIISP